MIKWNGVSPILGGLALAIFVAQLPNTAFADVDDVYASGLITFVVDDEDRAVDNGVAGGQLGIGWKLAEHFNLELDMLLLDMDGGRYDQEQIALSLNLLNIYNRDGMFSPYILGGLGFVSTNFSSAGVTCGTAGQPSCSNQENLQLNVGGGVLYNFTDRWSVRSDVIYRWEDADPSSLGDWLINVGVQVGIGGKARAAEPVVVAAEADSDGDGVPDSVDDCPNTAAGAAVDRYGCALDTDADGVPDWKDQCPDTEWGVEVDEYGCDLIKDSDGDGVTDDIDQCPNTAPGVPVDTVGCEIKEVIRLPEVMFETNSDVLLPGAKRSLNDAAGSLNQNPDLLVEVAGHTDNTGNADYNMSLSLRRAESVRDYLIQQGVTPSRLQARGYGITSPIASNSTVAGRSENRRVDLNITNHD
ncbi:MAG: OmpA family protein [Gammaproteobacteria bacterium]